MREAPASSPLCIRWTVGDVSPAGFEALRLSIHGARRLFGQDAIYAVSVNTLPVAEAQRRTGPLPGPVSWHRTDGAVPDWLRPHLGDGMGEGTAWKLVPPRLIPGTDELALDNDVILWDMPRSIRDWLAGGRRVPLIAADVTPAHGRFAALCGPEPRNSGIRGIPARFDFTGAMAAILHETGARITSELDEQGLQVAALSRGAAPLVVTTDEVSICSPFPPHYYGRGACGAHFVGLNAREIPFTFCGRPALDVRLEHWKSHLPTLHDRVGLPYVGASPARAEAG